MKRKNINVIGSQTVLEIEKYVPHPEKAGMLQYAGRITYGEFEEALNWFLKERGYQDQMESNGLPANVELRAGINVDHKVWELPKYNHLAVFTVSGTNEGYYIQVEALTPASRTTLYYCRVLGQGMDWCYEVCREIAKFIQA